MEIKYAFINPSPRQQAEQTLKLDERNPDAVFEALSALIGRSIYVRGVTRSLTHAELKEQWLLAVTEGRTESSLGEWIADANH